MFLSSSDSSAQHIAINIKYPGEKRNGYSDGSSSIHATNGMKNKTYLQFTSDIHSFIIKHSPTTIDAAEEEKM